MITVFIGTTELLLIGGLALLLVGGKKLPEMMRGLGKGVREFKDGMKEGGGAPGGGDNSEPAASNDVAATGEKTSSDAEEK